MPLRDLIRVPGFLGKLDKLNSMRRCLEEGYIYRGCRPGEVDGALPLGDCWTHVRSVAKRYADAYNGPLVATPIINVLNSRKRAVGLANSDVIWIAPQMKDILEIDGKRVC